MAYLEALLLSLLVGAGGTAAGAGIALGLKHIGRRLSGALLGLAGGLMLAIALLDMLPEAQESGGSLLTILSALAGAAAVYFISKGTHHHEMHDAEGVEPRVVQEHDLLRTGLILAGGVSIHNMPQGLAIGSSVLVGMAWPLSILLLLHNIPEGMAMALPLRIGRVSALKTMGVALLTAIPTVIGAIIGVAVSEISETFVAFSLAFAGGAMTFLTIAELIPQAASYGSRFLLIASTAASFLLGALLVWVLE